MGYPRTIRNFNAFLDGVSYMGLVSTAKLPALKIKAGFFDSEWFDGAQVEALSRLGGKKDMRGAVASTLYGILASTAGVLQAPIRDFALTLKALEEKKQAEAGGQA